MLRIVCAITALLCIGFNSANAQCARPAITQLSGSTPFKAQDDIICYGDLLLSDDFNSINRDIWTYDTWAGDANGEFQQYTEDGRVIWAADGKLHIKPRIMDGAFAKNDSDTVVIQGRAPINSGKLFTKAAFRFCKAEIRARAPRGAWLWPAIWMMPQSDTYGGWPASGEIDIFESRGNDRLNSAGKEIGGKLEFSTLHWGPDWSLNRYTYTQWEKYNGEHWGNQFHNYEVEWTDNHIKFSVDGQETGSVYPPNGGFWELGNLAQTGKKNPWAGGSKMAPFDKPFYFIINTAIGGTNGYFPDFTDPAKPYGNGSPTAANDFWNNRDQWLPSWNLDSDISEFQFEHIKVWAV